MIEAVLDHDSGTMSSKDTSDVYATREPQIAFNQRIEFCLDLHNHSVRFFFFLDIWGIFVDHLLTLRLFSEESPDTGEIFVGLRLTMWPQIRCSLMTRAV